MIDDAPVAPARRRRWPRIAVAAFLALSGLQSVLYAGILPLPPFSDEPVPPALWALGVGELVAALGVYRGRSWGRWLAIVVVTVMLVLTCLLALEAIDRMDSVVPVVTSLASVFVDIVLLWWLGWRWSVDGKRG